MIKANRKLCNGKWFICVIISGIKSTQFGVFIKEKAFTAMFDDSHSLNYTIFYFIDKDLL